MSRTVSLLVASLGNPPPYHSTRHSAAHIVLRSLQTQLSLPPFTLKSKPWASGSVSRGADTGHPEFTLWQSPSLMNVSGPSVLKAWKQFLALSGGASQNSDVVTGLVVLHDEMEINPGLIKVRRGGNSSVKGHNGLKSVQASLSGPGLLEGLGDRFVKVGIGIGRPPGGSRESRDVSAYVLGQVTPREKDGLERAVGEVAGVLRGEITRLGGGGVIEF